MIFRSSSKKYLLLCFITLFSSTGVLFAIEDLEDDVITVNADKIEQTIDESIERKNIITDEEIKKSGAKNVGDVLKSLPEIDVKSATAGNSTESITMQGLGNDYGKMNVDRVKERENIT